MFKKLYINKQQGSNQRLNNAPINASNIFVCFSRFLHLNFQIVLKL